MDDMEQRVRARAYEIWENEGQPHGREHEHWQQARQELSEVMANTGKPATPRAKRTGAGQASGRAKKSASAAGDAAGAGQESAPKPGRKPAAKPSSAAKRQKSG